ERDPHMFRIPLSRIAKSSTTDGRCSFSNTGSQFSVATGSAWRHPRAEKSLPNTLIRGSSSKRLQERRPRSVAYATRSGKKCRRARFADYPSCLGAFFATFLAAAFFAAFLVTFFTAFLAVLFLAVLFFAAVFFAVFLAAVRFAAFFADPPPAATFSRRSASSSAARSIVMASTVSVLRIEAFVSPSVT